MSRARSENFASKNEFGREKEIVLLIRRTLAASNYFSRHRLWERAWKLRGQPFNVLHKHETTRPNPI